MTDSIERTLRIRAKRWAVRLRLVLSHPFVATVAAGLALAFVFWSLKHFPWLTVGEVPSQLAAAARAAIVFLRSDVSVQWWVVILLALLASPLLVFAFVVVGMDSIKYPARRAFKSLTYRSYNADHFYGLDWRWSYDREGFPEGFSLICKHCRDWLYVDRWVPADAMPGSWLECRKCLTRVRAPRGELQELREKLRILVERRIRTGFFVFCLLRAHRMFRDASTKGMQWVAAPTRATYKDGKVEYIAIRLDEVWNGR